MSVFTQGNAPLGSLSVPDIYVNVQAPPPAALNGVPSGIGGFVGTATWGPVNSPVTVGDINSAVLVFGPVQNRKYDMLTGVAIAQQLGANNFRLVRVTDGTDVAATIIVLATCITFTSKYTGSLGNSISVAIGPGTAASTFKATVSLVGHAPEIFDNIAGSGNALWVAMAAAINNGQSLNRPASTMIVASAGAGTTAPTTASYALAGGTDGATTITSTVLLGVDTVPRSGMYALRGTGCAIFDLCDCDTAASWGTQLTFALSETMQAAAVSPAGDTLANIASTQTQDNPWLKVCFGDWAYWVDTANNITRLCSPAHFYMGMKLNLGPHLSALNKPLPNVVATQKSTLNQTYTSADLIALAAARVDVIANPIPNGAQFGFRFGRNTSSDPGRHQDSYTTLTNFIALTINAGAGQFVGLNISPTELRQAGVSIGGFLDVLQTAKMIGNALGTVPYQVTTTSGAQGSGSQTASVMVQYFDVDEYFIVNLTGGATVQIVSIPPVVQ